MLVGVDWSIPVGRLRWIARRGGSVCRCAVVAAVARSLWASHRGSVVVGFAMGWSQWLGRRGFIAGLGGVGRCGLVGCCRLVVMGWWR